MVEAALLVELRIAPTIYIDERVCGLMVGWQRGGRRS